MKFQPKVVVHEAAVTVGAGGEEQPWETECRVANAFYISQIFLLFYISQIFLIFYISQILVFNVSFEFQFEGLYIQQTYLSLIYLKIFNFENFQMP